MLEANLIKLGIRRDLPSTDWKAIDLLIINNRQNNPRWIVPTNLKKPLFLKLYTISTRKSKLYSFVLGAVFFRELQRLCFKVKTYCFDPAGSVFADIIKEDDLNWALFTGTVGPTNKLVMYTSHGAKGRFYKIPATKRAERLCKNEYKTLKMLEKYNLESFRFPNVSRVKNNIIKLEDVSYGQQRSSDISNTNFKALHELNKKQVK